LAVSRFILAYPEIAVEPYPALIKEIVRKVKKYILLGSF
jgi:hypothetical protein